MSPMVEVRTLTGPAYVRPQSVVLVRPAPDGVRDRALIVLECGHELVVLGPVPEVVTMLRLPTGSEKPRNAA